MKKKLKYTALFQGIELEGVHYGRHTLFVQSDVTGDAIKYQLKVRLNQFEQVYFGARHNEYTSETSFVNIYTFRTIARDYSNLIVTAAITSKELLKGFTLVNKNEELVVLVKSFRELEELHSILTLSAREKIQFKIFSSNGVLLIPASAVFATPVSRYKLLKDEWLPQHEE